MSANLSNDIKVKAVSIFKKIKREHGINCGIKVMNPDDGLLMSYSPNDNMIWINPDNIADNFSTAGFKRALPGITLRNFLTILLAHEIGHYDDFKVNPHLFLPEGNTIKELELNAWENGLKYITNDIKEDYLKFKDISLEHYERDGFFE